MARSPISQYLATIEAATNERGSALVLHNCVIYQPDLLCKSTKLMNTCAITLEEQAEKVPVASAYRSSVGRPKKFSQQWNIVMKRIYITEGKLQDFRCLKKAKGLASNDTTLHYLLESYQLDSSNVLPSNLVPTLSLTPVRGGTSGRRPSLDFDCCDGIV